jgi:hypothetical protein
MRFPIDTTAMTFTCATGVAPVKDYGNGQQKATGDGEPLFSVGVLAMANGEAELISVKVAGKVGGGIVPGVALRIDGLVAAHWSIDSKSGLYFRAAKVDPSTAAVKAAS